MGLFAAALAAAILLSPDAGVAAVSGDGQQEQLPVSESAYAEWSDTGGFCQKCEPEERQPLAVPASFRQCRTGGMGSDTCEIRCNRMFGFYYTDCEVECIDGYYACCNCADGAICRCYMDHEELWPVRRSD
jgi:hypothetical protein